MAPAAFFQVSLIEVLACLVDLSWSTEYLLPAGPSSDAALMIAFSAAWAEAPFPIGVPSSPLIVDGSTGGGVGAGFSFILNCTAISPVKLPVPVIVTVAVPTFILLVYETV